MRIVWLLLILFAAKTLYAKPSLENLTEKIETLLPLDETGKWKVEIENKRANGHIYSVWCKEEDGQQERIVFVSSPYKTAEIPALARLIQSALLPVKIQPGADWEVLKTKEKEALLKWSTSPENVSFCKLILGGHALHSISYTCKGKKVSQMNQNKWVSFLQHARLRNN